MTTASSAEQFAGFTHGMGIGGWLTNYKRFNAAVPVEISVDGRRF